MNGFEPLRRRIIDYTVAGQWSEVYDGPIEGCETEQLKAENAKLRNQLEEQKCFAADLEKDVRALRELVRDMMRFFEDGDYCTICEKAAECESPDEYESDCLMRGVFKRRMAELGIEVDA